MDFYLEDKKGNKLPRFLAPWMNFADPELESNYVPHRGDRVSQRLRLLSLVVAAATFVRGADADGDGGPAAAVHTRAGQAALVAVLATMAPGALLMRRWLAVPVAVALGLLWAEAAGGVTADALLRSVVVAAAAHVGVMAASLLPWYLGAQAALVHVAVWTLRAHAARGALAAAGGAALQLLLLLLLSARAVAVDHEAHLNFYQFLRLAEGSHLTAGVPFTQRPRDEDASLLGELPKDFSPVFISGMHRSGTTFLYRSLAGALPVARFTIYDLVMFPRLLRAHASGTRKSEQIAMNRYFSLVGQATRRLDSTPARHDACEEHGFLLQSLSGKNYVCEANGELMGTVARKLRFTQGHDSDVVLLKNPYDYGHEEEMLRVFPNARFVHLIRDPVDSYNSVCNAMEAVVAPFYYVYMQLCTRHDRGPKTQYGAMQLLLWAFGHEGWMRRLLKGLAKNWRKNSDAGRAAVQRLPRDKVYELTYEQLVADPGAQVQAIADFIGVPADADAVAALQSSPRAPKIHPCVELYREIVSPST